MKRIPEPHELADAYYARLDEEWERTLATGTCETCGNYDAAPAEWAYTPFGKCRKNGEWVLADNPAADCDTDYEPRDC